MRSQGFRFFIVAVLALMMMVPMTMVSEVIQSRADYSRSTIESVGLEWGGAQRISGPVLVIPVQEEVTSRKRRDIIDLATGTVQRHPVTGEVLYEYYDTTEVVSRASVYLFPDDFHVSVTSQTQTRHRGIFEVPVYSAQVEAAFNYPTDDAVDILVNDEELLWDQAELRVLLSTNRSLRGQAILRADGAELALEPLTDVGGGIFAYTGCFT